MQKVIYKNSKGGFIDFTDGDFGIVNISGLSETELNVQSQKVPFQDGGVFLDALIQERNINITVAINDEKDLEKRYRLKREIIKILNPKFGEGTLIYQNDFIKKQIKAIPQLPVFSNKNSNDSGTLKSNLVFECHSPYWEDIYETENVLEFTKRIVVDNEGDTETEVEIEISTVGVTNPQIKNLTTGKKIELIGEFNKGIRIDTHSGKKTIYEEENRFEVFGDNLKSNSVCYSSKLGLFVAVGSGGKILTSTNGSTWVISNRVSNTALNYYDLNSVCYSEKLGLFVAVGEYMSYSSTDGVNWIENNCRGNGICYSEKLGLFVAVGTGFYKSTNGIKWTYESSEQEMFSVCYSEKLNCFMACGYYEYIYKSTDGSNWTLTNSTTESATSLGITYSEKLGLFVAVGKRILTSTDGSNWTVYTVSKGLRSVCFSNILNLFVAVGGNSAYETPYMMVSGDSVNWTEIDTSKFSGCLNNVVYSTELNLFVCVTSKGKFLTSTDGYNWTIKNDAISENLNSVCYSEKLDLFVAVGNYHLYKSSDGINWNVTDQNFEYLNSVCYSEKLGLFVFVGVQSRIYTTSDLKTFKPGTISNYSGNANLKSVCYSEKLNRFVAVGAYDLIITSTDGSNWIVRQYSSGANDPLNSVCYSEKLGLFVVVGNYGEITKSSDGLTFNSVTHSERGVDINYNSITYSEELGLFVISCGGKNSTYGTSTNGKLKTSYNLTEWTDFSLKSKYHLNSVVYSKSLKIFITVGQQGVVYTSSDGYQWKLFGDFCGTLKSSIATNDRKIIIVGEIDFISFVEDVENKIETLSQDSDMNFTLDVGENELMLNYDNGSAVGVIRFRNKYIGV